MNPRNPTSTPAPATAPAASSDPLEHFRRESPREARIDYAVAVALALVAAVSERLSPSDPFAWNLPFFLWTPLFAWSAAAWMVVGRTQLVWACARLSFREEMHLANLRPSDCLEARLRGPLLRLYPCILIPAIPGLVTRALVLQTMIVEGAMILLTYGLGPVLIALIARSAFYEMTIQARSSDSTRGLVAARGLVALALRQVPAVVGVGFISMAAFIAVSLILTALHSPRELGFSRLSDLPELGAIVFSLSVIGGLGGWILRRMWRHITARRDYARRRMDAFD